MCRWKPAVHDAVGGCGARGDASVCRCGGYTMKASVAVMVLAVLFATAAAQAGDGSKSSSTGSIPVKLHFDSSDLSFDRYNGYDLISVPGCRFIREIGKPALPAKSVFVALPANSDLTGVEVVSCMTKTLPGEYMILPAQPPIPTMAGAAAEFVMPGSVYDSSDVYPGAVCGGVSVGSLRGYKILSFRVFPLQYSPAERELILYEEIILDVKYETPRYAAAGTGDAGMAGREDDEFYRIAAGLVVNPGDVSRVMPKTRNIKEDRIMPLSKSTLPDGDVDYVIITNDSLEDEFQRLADWKTKKGVPATVVNTSWIESSYAGTGVDTQERLRKFIADARTAWGTEWVLLGGDTGIIPCRGRYGWVNGSTALENESYEAKAIPADLYYSDLDGDWDANGNLTYGEVNDSIDLYPDVFVGRAPVDSVAEARTFVNKTLRYEKNPPTNYTLDILFLAEYLDDESGGGGSVGYSGNSRHGWHDPELPPEEGPSDLYDREFFNITFNESAYHLGEVVGYSKVRYIPLSQEDETAMRWLQYAINLLGDPELPIWTGTPRNFLISMPSQIPAGKQTLVINVSEIGHDNRSVQVQDATVCIMKSGEVYNVSKTDASGLARFTIDPDAGGLDVTVTKGNYRVYEDIIDIYRVPDIYVNTNGWWRDGGALNASTTPVQAGIDNATTGETIFVKAGNYTENVDIETSHLTLVGEGADVVTVTAASDLDHVFMVTASYVNVSGFGISVLCVAATDWSTKSGIYLNGVDHCNISGNAISHYRDGIHLNSSSNNTLLNNTASGRSGLSSNGIYMMSSSNNILSGNIVSGNIYGIRMESSSNNTLLNNTANSNKRYGIYIMSSSNNTLLNNTARGNDYGIYMMSSSNTLSGNIASGNVYGIYIGSSSNNALLNNTVSNNDNGICVSSCKYSLFANNTASNNDYYGIRMASSSNNMLTGNTARKNGAATGIGIWLTASCKYNTLIGNTASNNRWFGICLWSSENNTLASNIASGNSHGIMMESSSNNTLLNNTASNNDNGIFLTSSCKYNTLLNNTASNNGNGICLTSSCKYNLFANNTASNSDYHGICISSSNNTLVGNIASNNDYGIYLPSSNNTLVGNIASGNAYGIRMESSSNNMLVNNTASNNDNGICLSSSSDNNMLTGNTAQENGYGIHLYNADGNNIVGNWVHNNKNAGFCLASGSTDNNISYNNIIANGGYNATSGGYEWQFKNNQSDDVNATNNWWGTTDNDIINASIFDWQDDPDKGIVTYLPILRQPACTPGPGLRAFTPTDVAIALHIAVGSRPPNPRWDVNGDGSATSLDALMILQAAAGSIEL